MKGVTRSLIPYIFAITIAGTGGLLLFWVTNAAKGMAHSKPAFLVILAFVAASLCVFSYFTYADRRLLRQSLRSIRWVKAEATIASVEDSSFVIDSVSQFTTARATRYPELKCIYRFKVDGTRYEGSRYSFGGNVDQNWPDLSPGEKVAIYHDPADPSQSVVKRLGITLLLSPLLLLVSAACICWLLVP